MHPSFRLGAIALGIVASLAFVPPAQAYVCSRVTDSSGMPVGASIAWFTRNVPRAYNQTGTASLDATQTFNTFDTAFSTWKNLTLRPTEDASCKGVGTNLDFGTAAKTPQAFVGYNFLAPETNQNLLLFRDSNWTHDTSVIALTTTTYNSLTGEIFDADIEFNSKNFIFSIGDTSIKTDLLNTVTHEIGHLLGFAHSLDPNATMYGQAPDHDTMKRMLTCDDVGIAVLRYPAGSAAVGYCDPPAQSCGYCAKPGVLKDRATISVKDSDDGRGGCQAVAGSLVVPLLGVGLAWARGARRRPKVFY